MNNYTRLTEKERLLIEMYVRENRGIREIGRLVGRPGKTISLEIQRNGGYLRYYAPQAHANRVISNREGYSKISENPQLESYIRSRLQERWAPEIIAGKWNLENQDLTISYEAIYQWVYNQAGDLYKLLPRQKKIRGLKPQRSKSKIPTEYQFIQDLMLLIIALNWVIGNAILCFSKAINLKIFCQPLKEKPVWLC